MRVGDLLGLRTETVGGRRLGHVHDLCARVRDGRLEIDELLVGARGARSRLGIRGGRIRTRTIAWSDVRRVEAHRVVVSEDADA